MKPPESNLSTLLFKHQADWESWLAAHGTSSGGVWLRLAKKGSALRSVSYAEALESALCYGWIDGQKKPESEEAWLQRFTPRRPKSIWSKINREKAAALMTTGRMQPAGLEQVERARSDGRWEAAYDSPSKAAMPDDFAAALEQNGRAKAFFATLDRTNRYAVLWRIQTAKTGKTRARRIGQFVEMLAKHEKLHP
ncbi:MAG: YdeI/OmpD-associated family protein [Bryobacteraceae bacterium]